jgi:iron complex transport system permease protein
MSGTTASTETPEKRETADSPATGRSGRTRHLEWVDRSLVTFCLASLAIVGGGGLVQVRYGSYTMDVATAWGALLDPTVLLDPRWLLHFFVGDPLMRAVTGFQGELPDLPTATLVVWNIRLPRVFSAILVGVTLSISGAIFQAVTRNELASPFILGVSQGAGFAILATLVVFSGLAGYLPLIAAVGGTLAFLIVYAIAWQGGTSPVRLVLAGVIVNMIFQSLQRGLFFFADDLGVVQSAIAWITGSLTGTGWEHVRIALVPSVVAISVALASARQLDVLQLGEETARSLGMRVERTRFLLSAVAILAASTAVAVAGVVGFFGLVVPHVVRIVVGSDHRRLLVGCVFAGPALLVVADVGARLTLSPTQVPVGVVTGLIGGPYFLYLLRRNRSLGAIR